MSRLQAFIVDSISKFRYFLGDYGWFITFGVIGILLLKSYMDPMIVDWKNDMAKTWVSLGGVTGGPGNMPSLELFM